MEITVDFGQVDQILNFTPLELIWFVFTSGGWIAALATVLYGLFYLRLFLKRKEYLLKKTEYIMLAIDIPKDNEQSLIAVEQIFATLSGIKVGGNMYEKYWLGQTQLSFSLEIISLEGYIQFLIRTPSKFKDLVEAAIYAQYPEAEITEVEDYINLVPTDVHKLSSDFEVWATEFTLEKHSSYPIKTYKQFEHQLSGIFVDPMASLLEVMSKLTKGEQLGLQLVITPVGDRWKKKGEEIVKKLIGEKSESSKHFGDKLVDQAISGLGKFSEGVYKMWGDIKEEKDTSHPNLYQFLTIGRKNVVEAIENKMGKICFSASFRIYYLAHKEVFHKGRGVNAILGSINQFNDANVNSFKKYKRLTTHRDYLLAKRRVARVKKKLLKLYRQRSRKGSAEFMLGTEELATIYHFPTITVKAPLLKKVESKKAEPPSGLPIELAPETKFFRPAVPAPAKTETKKPDKKAVLPEEMNYTIKQTLPGYDFDNDYFEERFAIKRDTLNKPVGKESDKQAEPPDNLPIAN